MKAWFEPFGCSMPQAMPGAKKLGESLSLENAKRANEALMLADMLKELDLCANAPAHRRTTQYRDVTWKALNSFALGGLHPLSRTLSGYPAQLCYDVTRNSNAIVALAAQLAAILSENPRNMDAIRRLHLEFADCFPFLTGSETLP